MLAVSYVLVTESVDAADDINKGIFSRNVRIVLAAATLVLFVAGIAMGR